MELPQHRTIGGTAAGDGEEGRGSLTVCATLDGATSSDDRVFPE